MKNRYILLCFFALLCAWINNIFIMLAILALIYIYYFKQMGKSIYILLLIYLLPLMRIQLLPTTNEQPTKFEGKVVELKKNYVLVEVESQKVVVFGMDDVSMDDVVAWEGKYQKLSGIHSMNAFHFPTNMARRGIFYSSQAENHQILSHKVTLRNALYLKSNQIKDDKSMAFVQEMLFQFSQDEKSFLWVASGMHISYLAFALSKILSRFITRNSSKVLSFCVIAFLGYTTVFSAAILRMLCFQLVAFFMPKFSYQDRIGCGAFLCIMLAPYMAFNIALLLPLSFQLSRVFYREKAQNFKTSLLICIPFQLYFYHQCNVIQILLFRYIRKVYSLIYIAMLICTCFQFMLFTMPFFLWVEQACIFIENLGFNFFYAPPLLWMLIWVCSSIWMLEFNSFKSKVVLVLLMLFSQYPNYLNPFGEVTIIDVGQGDCALVRLPFQKGVMLIDVMGSLYKDVVSDIIVPNLKGKGIRHIDQVIITHDDMDHSGGLAQLQELIPVDKVITDKGALLDLGQLKVGDLTSNIKGDDANDNSLVPFFEIDNISYAFMGDISTQIELAILQEYPNLKIDVLKVGHHGSKTSSHPDFIHQSNPKLSIISSGRNNRYNHPNKEVLDTLKNEESTVLNTQFNGDVSIYFSKYFHFFKTAEQEFGIIKPR